MKGNNTLLLNQVNIVEAVQFWLDQKVFAETAQRKVLSVAGPNLGASYNETPESASP